MAMLQSVNGLPDHGCGGLGRVAHGALTAPSDVPAWPRLFLGYNTLPDPPFPLVGYLQYELGPQAGEVEPQVLLRMMAESMRAQPVPPKESFDESRQRVATAMRVDAMVVVVRARAMAPGENEAARALWANLAEGYYREGDAEACAGARETVVALAVDRAGGRLTLMAEQDAAPVLLPGEARGPLFDLLGEVLDAQYTWTKAAFAL
ncbi:MAG: hypothetical protein HOW71_00900 [Nonomuraea sp.]|nr:hypothetical protein [Nonomuraea sp.]NUP60716.1 hypothetical protein [Nonomuraea sp.]NUS04861.1 hypothetical protein [Nonomuraea sp.]